MKLDPGVIELLKLDPDRTTVSSAGGGGCSSASTSKITTKSEDGLQKEFFMKTGRGKDADIMFEGRKSLFQIFHEAFVTDEIQANMRPSTRSTAPSQTSAHNRSVMANSPHRHRHPSW